MDLLDSFLARYMKEYDYYDQVARRAAQMLDLDLHAAGVRSIVTSRAKSPARLEEKCRQRHKKQPYTAMEDIYTDIVDLAGVRVALYFPAERAQVEGVIGRLFYHYQPKRVFPQSSQDFEGKRFSGYSADHYRVRLKTGDRNESDHRYAAANIEIQVASVLMHAWSEVEHDLVYKPAEGELSEAEYSLLDQLNGLVIAGEIGLEQLQKAGETRVASGGSRPFSNHYELAAHLLSKASAVNEDPITDSGLGRIDLLFSLLARLELNSPDGLSPYLELLHGDLERRPLSEQIIDALIEEERSRYETYLAVRADAGASRTEQAGADGGAYAEIGLFLTQWVRFERLLRELAHNLGSGRPVVPTTRILDQLQFIDGETRFELDRLRRVRNELVHGIGVQSPDYLREAAQRLAALIDRIESQLGSQ